MTSQIHSGFIQTQKDQSFKRQFYDCKVNELDTETMYTLPLFKSLLRLSQRHHVMRSVLVVCCHSGARSRQRGQRILYCRYEYTKTCVCVCVFLCFSEEHSEGQRGHPQGQLPAQQVAGDGPRGSGHAHPLCVSAHPPTQPPQHQRGQQVRECQGSHREMIVLFLVTCGRRYNRKNKYRTK